MRRTTIAVVLAAIASASPHAQEATTKQGRDDDLVQLASIYAKNYGPYEWKRDALGCPTWIRYGRS
jgi:hypothetical protein